MYYYKITDFIIASAFEIFLLAKSQTKLIEAAKVVYLQLGAIPQINYSEGWEVGVTYTYSETKSEFLIELPTIARYYVKPNELIIEPIKNADWKSVELFLVTSALPIILHYQEKTPLLASSFLKENELILVTGRSGHGKSTLTALMERKGFLPFSDDLLCLSLSDSNRVQVEAVHSNLFLWRDSITYMNSQLYHLLNPVREGIAKFIHEIPAQNQNAKPKIAKIIILSSSGKPHAITQPNKIEALQTINDFVPYSMLLNSPIAQKRNFLLMTELVNKTVVYKVNRCIKRNSPNFINFFANEIS